MNYNTDGFNERSIYLHNQNDRNKLNKMGSRNIDSSFAKMKINENRPDIKTINTDKKIIREEVRGNKENFVLRNNNMMNANTKVNPNNPVSNAMNKNLFNNFRNM